VREHCRRCTHAILLGNSPITDANVPTKQQIGKTIRDLDTKWGCSMLDDRHRPYLRLETESASTGSSLFMAIYKTPSYILVKILHVVEEKQVKTRHQSLTADFCVVCHKYWSSNIGNALKHSCLTGCKRLHPAITFVETYVQHQQITHTVIHNPHKHVP
jgi:hypothetical protein